jgi:hypothetical protein
MKEALSEGEAIRDRLWVWAHEAGVYNGAWGLPGGSRITPVEGAHYLGIPNAIFVRYSGQPEPPFDRYAVPFRSLRRVIWSVVGEGGRTSDAEREHVLSLARGLPNLTGFFMDDFFHLHPGRPWPEDGSVPAALSVEQVERVREQIRATGERLELGVTLYTHQLDPRIRPHLERCDLVSLWTWHAQELERLEENIARYREIMPESRTLLGLYMWDFGTHGPMPLDLMRHQCEVGLRWLRAGQMEGLVLLATNLCDLDLEAVEWTREWIRDTCR